MGSAARALGRRRAVPVHARRAGVLRVLVGFLLRSWRVTERDDRTLEINARLTEAAEAGRTVELILVVRGKVRPVNGGERWRVRTDTRHILTFRADAVVAATPVAGRRGRLTDPEAG